MAIEVTDLTTLDIETVQEIQETLAELVQEENPSIDAKQGVLYQLLFYYSAILAAAKQEEIDRVRRSMSLKAIEEDPELAEDDIVDRVLSNWGITRVDGAVSRGTITIVVNRLSTVTIPSGGVFEAGGLSFVTETPYVARTSSANVQSDTDRVLNARGDGTYSFTIDVVSSEQGAATQLKKGEALTPQFTIINFVKAFATNDFIGGLDTETNTELLQRQREGIATKALSGRINMKAYLRTIEGLENITASSIIGYGDAEMLRDKHSLFPISGGGRADWYVRTRPDPANLTVTKTATLIKKNIDNTGVWQVTLDRDDAPGFLRVVSVVPEGLNDFEGSFDITLEQRSVNLTEIEGELVPDIESSVEGVFSRYQTSTIQFHDTRTDVSALSVNESTASYDITVLYMPNIATAQTAVSNLNYRNYGGDVLIKAPVPCFLALSFTLQGKRGVEIPDLDLIKLDLVDYVNSLGFSGRIHASGVADIIHDRLPSNVAVSSIEIIGKLFKPNGTVKLLRSSDVLVIPDEPGNMVSAKTVNFFLDTNSISISLEGVNIPDV